MAMAGDAIPTVEMIGTTAVHVPSRGVHVTNLADTVRDWVKTSTRLIISPGVAFGECGKCHRGSVYFILDEHTIYEFHEYGVALWVLWKKSCTIRKGNAVSIGIEYFIAIGFISNYNQ